MSFSMEIAGDEVLKAVVEEQVKPVPEEVVKLKAQAEQNVQTIMEIDLDSLEKRKNILAAVENFGIETMRASSQKNALLQVTIGQLSRAGDEGGIVAKGLGELQLQMKDLDPSGIDFVKRGFLGKFFNPLRSYFHQFDKADMVIAEIIETLNKGKLGLKDDNTTLLLEQHALRDLTKKLRKEIQLVSYMDESIEAQIALAKARNDDPEKIQFITEEVLFPLRQRTLDMQAMMAVNQQGFITFEVVIRNNKELIRGVDRASTVTVAALRVAVTAASALANQRVVLKQLNALYNTTNTFIEHTGQMLKQQGVDIQKGAIEASISAESLKKAFADSFEALQAISTYKQEALPKMRETITQFRELAETGEKQILRLERGAAVGL
ncbi:hypothetical protein PAECIP111891_06629 [Paenibacillus allorhizoplanae]|uniref:Toxic anion resistance protein n=1 Tax=Paenibacillus allorhizoplanae TaxID=2905648 RepID=A0ABN8H9L5_9BACL|nr:toxic anion resistance protein [Paenibacillus allorhizoplanae]CAH1230135.1 hypothetical protein PAECIP111891_06629 [Paenibacillus allorhizoplanae]